MTRKGQHAMSDEQTEPIAVTTEAVVAEPTEHPCRVCGELTLGQRHDRLLCRECDLAQCIEAMRCTHCRRLIVNDLGLFFMGMVPDDHAPDCPERTT